MKSKKKIAKNNPNCCIDVFYSGYELLKVERIYDVVLLDIEMNGINGLKTAELLREKNNNEYIIFLTSHNEFMQEAFKVKAFRFLVKPINQRELNEALFKAKKEIFNNKNIIINERNRVKVIQINNIIFFESFGDGTYIYTKNEIYESIKTLKYWIGLVGNESFFQIHKSYLISLNYVKNLGDSSAEMQYFKQPLPISRRKFPLFKKAFLEYIKKNAEFL